MTGEDDEDDENIPLLQDMVRPGNVDSDAQRSSSNEQQSDQSDLPLSEAEIEAIAARVVERHIDNIEQAVARAIRTAIRLKARQQQKGADSGRESSS